MRPQRLVGGLGPVLRLGVRELDDLHAGLLHGGQLKALVCRHPPTGPLLDHANRIQHDLLHVLGQTVPFLQVHRDADAVPIQRMADEVLGDLVPPETGEAVVVRPGEALHRTPLQGEIDLRRRQGYRLRPHRLDEEARERRHPDLHALQVGRALDLLLGGHEVVAGVPVAREGAQVADTLLLVHLHHEIVQRMAGSAVGRLHGRELGDVPGLDHARPVVQGAIPDVEHAPHQRFGLVEGRHHFARPLEVDNHLAVGAPVHLFHVANTDVGRGRNHRRPGAHHVELHLRRHGSAPEHRQRRYNEYSDQAVSSHFHSSRLDTLQRAATQ